ncbi:MAG: hypothetical protein ABIE55_00920 [Candidatus Aenigmatarchaeota archaeon]
MKGIELPINVLIVVIIAVIVLFGLISLNSSGWSPFSETVSLESARTYYCKKLLLKCDSDVNLIEMDNFDADMDGILDPGIGIGDCSEEDGKAKDNLYMMCQCYYNSDEEQCRDVCMCKNVPPLKEQTPPLP